MGQFAYFILPAEIGTRVEIAVPETFDAANQAKFIPKEMIFDGKLAA